MIIELSEYELVDRGEQEGFIYALVDVTLHTSLHNAHRYVTRRTLQDGMPATITLGPGLVLPGKAWTTKEVNEVETLVRAGRDLAGDEENGSKIGFTLPDDISDPIPPDDAEPEDDPDQT